jgi:hypothetical protein
MYNAVLLPFYLGFEFTPGASTVGWEYFVDFLFVVDMALNFRTLLVDNRGNVNDDIEVIRSVYLRGWFIIDLLAIMPFELMLAGSGAEGQVGTTVDNHCLPCLCYQTFFFNLPYNAVRANAGR